MRFDTRTYDAWLASAELPYDSLIPLLHGLKGSQEIHSAWMDPEEPLFQMIPPNCRKRLSETADDDHLAVLQVQMQQGAIQSITIEEADYPQCLRNIPDPPGILFLQGDPDCLIKPRKAAVIGSRNATRAGILATGRIAEELSRNGVTIVSGLAFGIDAESHRGCLKGKSPTIAVMGCGLDRTYPV